jgi:hypothetical protein
MIADYRNSYCKDMRMHNYQITKVLSHGVIEVCTQCKDRQYFNNSVPNAVYLSYHICSLQYNASTTA